MLKKPLFIFGKRSGEKRKIDQKAPAKRGALLYSGLIISTILVSGSAFAIDENLCVQVFRDGSADYYYSSVNIQRRTDFHSEMCKLDVSNTSAMADIVYEGIPISASFISEYQQNICTMDQYSHSEQINRIKSMSTKSSVVYDAFNKCLEVLSQSRDLDYRVFRHRDVSKPVDITAMLTYEFFGISDLLTPNINTSGINLFATIRWDVQIDNNPPNLTRIDQGSYMNCSLYDENMDLIGGAGNINRALIRKWYTLICLRDPSSRDLNPTVTLFFSNLQKPLEIAAWPTRPLAPVWPIWLRESGQNCSGGKKERFALVDGPGPRILAKTPNGSCEATCNVTNDGEVFSFVKNGQYGESTGVMTNRATKGRTSESTVGAPSGIPAYGAWCYIEKAPEDETARYRSR